VLRMKELYGEGPATHTGPESCVGVRKGDVLTLDVPELTQPLPEGIHGGRGRGRPVGQDAHARHFPGRLRRGGERRGKQTATETAKKGSPSNHRLAHLIPPSYLGGSAECPGGRRRVLDPVGAHNAWLSGRLCRSAQA